MGYAPGCTADPIARIIATGLSKRTGAPVIVDNKAGADERVAASFVARAKPDGYTLYLRPLARSIGWHHKEHRPHVLRAAR